MERAQLENSWSPYFLRIHGRRRGIFSLRHSPIGVRQPPTVVDSWEEYEASVADPGPLRQTDAKIPVLSSAGRRFMLTDVGYAFPHAFERWSPEDITTDMGVLEAVRDQTAKARASERALGNSIGFLTNWVAMGGIAVLVLVFVVIVLTVFLSDRVGVPVVTP